MAAHEDVGAREVRGGGLDGALDDVPLEAPHQGLGRDVQDLHQREEDVLADRASLLVVGARAGGARGVAVVEVDGVGAAGAADDDKLLPARTSNQVHLLPGCAHEPPRVDVERPPRLDVAGDVPVALPGAALVGAVAGARPPRQLHRAMRRRGRGGGAFGRGPSLGRGAFLLGLALHQRRQFLLECISAMGIAPKHSIHEHTSAHRYIIMTRKRQRECKPPMRENLNVLGM